MADKLVRLEAERARRDPDWAPMPLSENICNIVKVCARRPALAIIGAASGLGKSHALRRSALEVPTTGLVTLNRASGSMSAGLLAIMDAVAAHPAYAGYSAVRSHAAVPQAATLMRKVTRAFERAAHHQDALPVLAIDEAQFARPSLLDCLRFLYDAELASLVIAGNDAFSTEGLAPLVSRAAFEIDAAAAGAADVDAFLDHRGVADATARRLLHHVAGLRGIRGVDELLKRAGGADAPLARLQVAARTMRFLPTRR